MGALPFYEKPIKKVDGNGPWASVEEMARFAPPTPQEGVILANGAGLSVSDETPWQYSTNRNVAVIGGSGSGKSRSFVMPNLINHLGANYVITDTKRELYRLTARGFEEDGYEVVRLDAADPSRSCRFNPLQYVRTVQDVPKIAEIILESIDPSRRNIGKTENEAFWVKTETMLMCACVGLLLVLEERFGALAPGAAPGSPYVYLTMKRLLELLDLVQVPDEGSSGVARPSPLDRAFATLAQGNAAGAMSKMTIRFEADPAGYAVRQYYDFKVAARRTMASIVISLNADLSRLKTPELMRIFSGDDLELDRIDEGKRVIYLAMSDNESSTAFLGRMAFRLLLNRTLAQADDREDGRLAKPLTFMCDEFANLGALQDFERVISIARSRRINFLLCLQSVSQLKRVYGPACATIILDNCDAMVLMGGGSSYESAEYFSRLCGTSQIGTELVGIERNRKGIQDYVMSASDIARLPREQCIVRIAGARPFLTTKFDVRKHPNASRFLDVA